MGKSVPYVLPLYTRPSFLENSFGQDGEFDSVSAGAGDPKNRRTQPRPTRATWPQRLALAPSMHSRDTQPPERWIELCHRILEGL